MGAAMGAALDEAAPLDDAAPLEEAIRFGLVAVGLRFGNGDRDRALDFDVGFGNGNGDRDRALAFDVGFGNGFDVGIRRATTDGGTVVAKILCKILPTMFSSQPCLRKYPKACDILFFSQMSLTMLMSRPTTRRFRVRYAMRASSNEHPHSRQKNKAPKGTAPMFALSAMDEDGLSEQHRNQHQLVFSHCVQED